MLCLLSIPFFFSIQFGQIAVLCVRQSNLQGRTQSGMVLIVAQVLGEVVSSAGWGKFALPARLLASKRLWMESVECCDERSP